MSDTTIQGIRRARLYFETNEELVKEYVAQEQHHLENLNEGSRVYEQTKKCLEEAQAALNFTPDKKPLPRS